MRVASARLGSPLLGGLLQIGDPLLLCGMVGPRFLLKGSRAVLEELLLPAVEDRGLESLLVTQLRDRPVAADASLGWQLSLPACSASVASSCVRSIILTGERFSISRLNRNRQRSTRFAIRLPPQSPHRLFAIDELQQPRRAGDESNAPFGISSHATAALATDRPAQIKMTSRNPNTNASPIESLTAALVLSSTPTGNCRPASLISSALMSWRTLTVSERLASWRFSR